MCSDDSKCPYKVVTVCSWWTFSIVLMIANITCFTRELPAWATPTSISLLFASISLIVYLIHAWVSHADSAFKRSMPYLQIAWRE